MLLWEERTSSADNFKKKLDKENKMGSIRVQFVFKASFHLRGMYSRQRWDLSYSSKKPKNLGLWITLCKWLKGLWEPESKTVSGDIN